VRGDACWYWWNCWPSLNEFKWEVVFVDIGGIVDHHSMSWDERWFLLILVELIEWWSTIPPISTKIISHLNSLTDGQQFHQYQQKSPLTSAHWVMVNNSTNINKNQWVKMRGDFYWYWWNCWPSINELRWEVIFINIGGIVTSTHWVMSTIPPISTKITSHFNSLSDSQQFHQNQPESPLT
jgi:hypothetical protein